MGERLVRLRPVVILLIGLLVFSCFFNCVNNEAAHAAVPRVVLAELSTATWCGYCPLATQPINQLADQYGPTQLLVLQYHPNDGSDPFGNPQSQSRINYYNVTGYPTMVFDGTSTIIGGQSSNLATYTSTINDELQKASDFSIGLKGPMSGFSAVITNSGSQAVTASAVFALYEDNIPFNAPNGETNFRFTVRSVITQTANFAVGQPVTFQESFQPQAGWNSSNLRVVAFVQRDDTKAILEAAILPRVIDFSLSSSDSVKVTQPNAITPFNAVLTNTGVNNDTYSISISEFLPSGWSAEICYNGLCYSNYSTLFLTAGSFTNLTVNIITSSTLGAGTVSLNVTSLTDATRTSSLTFVARDGNIQIQFSSYSISDTPQQGEWGDGHGDANPGEMIDMNLTLVNTGLVDSYNVSATLSTTDPYVTDIATNSAKYGNIPIGLTATSQTSYRFNVSSSCPVPHTINFNLAINDSEGGNCTNSFTLTVTQPTRSAIYIYSTDQSNAVSAANILGTNGVLTSTITPNNLQSTILSSYDTIIIGNDATSIPNPQNLISLNKPILGIGQGGTNFFASIGLAMTNKAILRAFDGTALVQDSAKNVFNFPTQIAIPQNQALTISAASNSMQTIIDSSNNNVTSFVSASDNSSYSLVSLEGNRYMLWGPLAAFSTYTDTGKTLFVNCIQNLLKAPYPLTFKLNYQSGIGTTYKNGWWMNTLSVPLSSTPAESGLKLPSSKYGNASYGYISLGYSGNTKYNFMIDGNSTGYLFYIDTNNDKDLTNEQAYYSTYGFVNFSNVPTLTIQYGGVQYNYQIAFEYWSKGYSYLYCYSYCYFEGYAQLEGSSFKIRTADEDVNSFYNNSNTDLFMIDLNKDGIIDCQPIWNKFVSEGFYWKTPFLINDQLYQVESVSVPGDQVVIGKAYPTAVAQLTASFSDTHIDTTRVTGRLTPYVPGSFIDIIYVSDNSTVVRSKVAVSSSSTFTDNPNLPFTGTWQMRASFAGDQNHQPISTSNSLITILSPAPTLTPTPTPTPTVTPTPTPTTNPTPTPIFVTPTPNTSNNNEQPTGTPSPPATRQPSQTPQPSLSIPELQPVIILTIFASTLVLSTLLKKKQFQKPQTL